MSQHEPRRHHYVPRFLLERFGSAPQNFIHQVDKESGQCICVNAINAAVVRDFYALVDEEGIRHQDAELALAQIEGIAAPLIERLEQRGAALTGEQRYTFAVFLGTLWLRTPLWRRRFQHTEEQLGEFFLRNSLPDQHQAAALAQGEEITLEEAAGRRQDVIDALDRGGIEIEANQARHVALLFEHAASTAWIIFRLDWELVRAPTGRSFVIGDEPVSGYAVQEGRAVRSAAPLQTPTTEMLIPLDPAFALILRPNAELLAEVRRDDGHELRTITEDQIEAQLGRPVGWSERELTELELRELNFRSYSHAQRWLYGQGQGALSDLRHEARRSAQRVVALKPRDPSFTVVHQMPGEHERVWRVPPRNPLRQRPRRRR